MSVVNFIRTVVFYTYFIILYVHYVQSLTQTVHAVTIDVSESYTKDDKRFTSYRYIARPDMSLTLLHIHVINQGEKNR